MKNNIRKILKKQNTTNNIAKHVSAFFAWFLVVIFLGLIGYIIYSSVPGFEEYGFNNIIFNDKYNINDSTNPNASIWLPLLITLIVTIGSLLISTPLAIKTSMFLHFRVKNETIKKTLKIIINISAAIPSVIFGLFASQTFGTLIKQIFGLDTTQTVLTAIFMLSFMLIPTQISLIINACEGADNSYISYTLSLGNTKTKAIYKVFRSQIRKAIIISIIVAAGRAIGETMAVSMILSSQDYGNVIHGGLISILKSSLSPLGAVISMGMFSENGGEGLRGLLYAFGVGMFIVVMLMNAIVIFASGERNKSTWFTKLQNSVGGFISIVPNQIGIWLEKITYHSPIKLNSSNYDKYLSSYIVNRIQTNKWMYVYSWYKRFWEIVSTLIVFGFIAWIGLEIIARGLVACSLTSSTVGSYLKNTTGQATLNTLLLILVSIILSLPLSLIIAIWLNEYAKNKKIKKTILFFIDSLGSTPSIIFGMFGLVFFIETCGIAAGGHMGKSLLAGILTIIIVILPTFTRMIQQSLEAVPMSIRENSYALGNSKWYTIKKLILPQAYKGIISSTIITVGRILAETAPLYLTAGLSSSSKIALLNPGQTLTTRIYAQLFNNNANESLNIMWESAFIVLILVIALILIGYVFIPYWPEFKSMIITYWNIEKSIYKFNDKANWSKYDSQIYKNILYLTDHQAKKLKLKHNELIAFKKNKKKIIVQIIDEHKMKKIEDEAQFINIGR